MHNSIDKALITHKGNVLTSGNAGNLAKGQLAFVSDESVSGGRKVLGGFAGFPKDKALQIRVGRGKLPTGLRTTNTPFYQTSFFKLKDIVSVKANFPKQTERKFDEFLIGYDGINASSALNIPEGKSSIIEIVIDGKPVEILAGEKEHLIKLRFGKEVGETDQQVVRKLVKRLQEYTLPRSRKQLSEFLEIGVVDSENVTLAGTSYTFSTISVVDNGDSNDLADIQAQYPAYQVVRTARTGLASEYTILHPTATALADYNLIQNSSYIKGCADCLAGYSAIVGGIVYHVTIEDDGVDLSTTVDDLPGFVTGTAVKVGQVDGRGVYSLVTDDTVTDAEIATFLAASAVKGTAVIKKIGSTETVCEDSNSTAYTWVAGSQNCKKTVEQYKIQLKDTDCDGSRLTEIQAQYPDLVIEAGVPTGVATQTVTVSTDADLEVIINGVSYETTDAGTVAQTATAFFSAHAAAILAATGTVVTNPSSAVLLFTDSAVGFPTITAASQTVGAIDFLTTATSGGCQRVYSTYVTTNLVCDECDDIFLQNFTSEAPRPYKGTPWEKVEVPFNEDALMGITIKGKPFDLKPIELTRDEIPFYETSTRIRSVSFGGREFDYLNITPAYSYDELATPQRLSRAVDRDNLGYMFFPVEEMSRMHFLGETREKNNNFAKANLSEESLIKFDAQYVTYHISWQDTSLSQGMGGRSNITHTEVIVVEHGYHDTIETMVNKLAAASGNDTVNPTAN